MVEGSQRLVVDKCRPIGMVAKAITPFPSSHSPEAKTTTTDKDTVYRNTLRLTSPTDLRLRLLNIS